MRGKPEQAFMLFVTVRITPADAGKTRLCGSLSARPEDHPRGCGENFTKTRPGGADIASPPRMRGKLSATPHCRIQGRITPAGAGKTMKEVPCVCVDEDHPRRCGENMMPNIFRSASQGSPPQVRGKRTRLYCNLTDNRITPADAGKTD